MKNLLILSLGLALSSLQAQTVATDPVGFTTITLPGKGTGTESTTFVSIPMLATPAYAGKITGINTATRKLTLSQAAFTSNQFTGANGLYYVEVTSGNQIGAIATIASNGTGDVTIIAAEDISPLVAQNDTVKIRKYQTIASVFGPNNESGFVASVGNNFSAADKILLPTSTGGFDFYYYNDGAADPNGPVTPPNFKGWRKVTDATFDTSAEILPPTLGFVLKHFTTAQLKIKVVGEVQTRSVQIPIPTGTSFAASGFPIDATLADVFGVNNQSGLTASIGNNFAAADKILVPTASGGFDFYYYNDGAADPNGPITPPNFKGWRKVTDATTDASGVVISSGTTSFVVKRDGADLVVTETPKF